MKLVKRKGHTEVFDQKKLYASVYAACMTLRMKEEEAELLAETVSGEVARTLASHDEISSQAIHSHVVKALHRYNSDAAFLYDTHRDLS